VALVRIERTVRQKVGAAGFSRSAIVRVFAWVYHELENRADRHRHNRVAVRPDCFIVRKTFLDGGASHHCAFIVDDQTPDLFRVEDFTHQRGG